MSTSEENERTIVPRLFDPPIVPPLADVIDELRERARCIKNIEIGPGPKLRIEFSEKCLAGFEKEDDPTVFFEKGIAQADRISKPREVHKGKHRRKQVTLRNGSFQYDESQ